MSHWFVFGSMYVKNYANYCFGLIVNEFLCKLCRSPHVLVVLQKPIQNRRSKQAMAYHSLATGWTCQYCYSVSIPFLLSFIHSLALIIFLLEKKVLFGIWIMNELWIVTYNQGASGVGIGNFEEVGPLDTFLKPRNSTWLQKADLLFVVSITFFRDLWHTTLIEIFITDLQKSFLRQTGV